MAKQRDRKGLPHGLDPEPATPHGIAREVAPRLRQLLEALETGELTAGATARSYIEGAAAALEELVKNTEEDDAR